MTPTDAPDVDLPPLPKQRWVWREPPNNLKRIFDGQTAYPSEGFFDADQMQAYALQAVLRERERCAKLADDNAAEAWDRSAARERDMWEHFSAAIRGRKERAMYYEEKLMDGELYCRTSPDGEWKLATSSHAQATKALLTLTDEQRRRAFSLFCTHCGSVDPRCQCWNDE